jgi:hypothetical protein
VSGDFTDFDFGDRGTFRVEQDGRMERLDYEEDFVARLRNAGNEARGLLCGQLCGEAADQIEKLTNALRPFAQVARGERLYAEPDHWHAAARLATKDV